jgi:hypothetical protein
MVVGRQYPYSLYIHCGVMSTEIDGRTFFADSPTGVRSAHFPNSGGHPSDPGTMTLVSHDVAVFRDDSGTTVRFIDHNPVVVGQPYTVEIAIAGPGRLDSSPFAGGLFAPRGVRSGRLRLPADGTSVSGTMTLDDADDARFSVGGAVVVYQRVTGYGCL